MMKMLPEEQYKARILHKLMKRRQWAAKHSEEKELLKGFDPRIFKELNKAKEELIKEGFIIVAIKTKERHISLNPRKYNEIIAIVEKYFDIQYLKCIR